MDQLCCYFRELSEKYTPEYAKSCIDINDMREGLILLHIASSSSHEACIRVLLENGANINCKSKYGWTALHFAMNYGNYTSAKLLLDHGADINEEDNVGDTPMDFVDDDFKDKIQNYILELQTPIKEPETN